MCLNPVHRQCVCEKLYHKMGYERKKLPEKKKKERASTVSTDVFQLCDLSFVLRLFFCLSASLGLIRPAVESGSLGKHSRVWLELRLNWGWWWEGASWGASTSDHFPHAIHHAVWSVGRLPPVLSPSSSFLSLLHLLPFHPTFLALSHNPCVRLLFPPDFHHPTFFSSFSYSSSCCPPFCARCLGKLTVTFGNDPLQTSAQWHHNKSRNSSPLPPPITLSAD